MSDKIVFLTDASFKKEVLEADVPVLVDFYADWCGPCKRLGPLMEQIAEEYDGRAKVCKLDIDANGETPASMGIRSIPTVKLFKGGKEIETKVGLSAKEVYTALIDKNL